ncbi:MAG: hypothetical protein A2277_06590 [Desulfobacterales bacterium RIFOXYA12_FULL_46_15]|nr:MAG: hypothetical protein A2277_06590 [Desulfobacterales bacterium RIFOXYA12_FULL_46_15]
MGHQDKGHFAAKHKAHRINEVVADKIKAIADNESITCSSAHQISKAVSLSPAEIGIQIDLLEFRITECQLGLFGYCNGGKKINPEIKITPDLGDRLEKSAVDGRLSCLSCWDIATDLKMKRIDMGSSCEKMNIRIKPCQLGSF